LTVVVDASPLHYLILIERTHLLPELFGSVLIPEAVLRELTVPSAPDAVRRFLQERPAWLHVVESERIPALPNLTALDPGEQEAIALAFPRRADLLLIDERAGYRLAAALGMPVAGLLRVLAMASSASLVNLEDAVNDLRATNFRVRPSLLEQLLKG
jgi:uncharacterized protein